VIKNEAHKHKKPSKKLKVANSTCKSLMLQERNRLTRQHTLKECLQITVNPSDSCCIQQFLFITFCTGQCRGAVAVLCEIWGKDSL